MIGKLVRWESDGQWFTARVRCTGVFRGSWAGEVVDPGNFIGPAAKSPYLVETKLTSGEWLPNLLSNLITVVEAEGQPA